MEFSDVLSWTMDVDGVLHQEEKRVFFGVFYGGDGVGARIIQEAEEGVGDADGQP